MKSRKEIWDDWKAVKSRQAPDRRLVIDDAFINQSLDHDNMAAYIKWERTPKDIRVEIRRRASGTYNYNLTERIVEGCIAIHKRKHRKVLDIFTLYG